MQISQKGVSKTLILVILGLAAVSLLFLFRGENIQTKPRETSAPPSAGAPSPREVSFTAPDGYALSATYWGSDAQPPQPAVILVHQFNSTRHDFDAFVPLLREHGYAVLAYDIRGFGESKNGPADINDFPKDVSGAVAYLKAQADVDHSRIGIIGASVGANVAFVASGSIPDIHAAVALSPSDTGARGVLLGNDVPQFSPGRILIASDEREKRDADAIFAKSGEPKEQRVYPGFGHGVGLLRSEEAQKDIISFLGRMLPPAAPSSRSDIHIPLVLHLVTHSGRVSTARDEENVRALLKKSQAIWDQAHIVFDPTFVETAFDKEAQAAVEQQAFQTLYERLPLRDGALHIVFVRTLGGLNGVAIPPSLALVADRTTVNDFRAAAHEIGHLLGLSHTSDSEARLLFRGANGTQLTEAEIDVARRTAESLRMSGATHS